MSTEFGVILSALMSFGAHTKVIYFDNSELYTGQWPTVVD